MSTEHLDWGKMDINIGKYTLDLASGNVVWHQKLPSPNHRVWCKNSKVDWRVGIEGIFIEILSQVKFFMTTLLTELYTPCSWVGGWWEFSSRVYRARGQCLKPHILIGIFVGDHQTWKLWMFSKMCDITVLSLMLRKSTRKETLCIGNHVLKTNTKATK